MMGLAMNRNDDERGQGLAAGDWAALSRVASAGCVASRVASAGLIGVLLVGLVLLPGCGGGIAYNTQASFSEGELAAQLNGQRVAVLAASSPDAEKYDALSAHKVGKAVVRELSSRAPKAEFVNPRDLTAFRGITPEWSAMTDQELRQTLDVDLVILIDLSEYQVQPHRSADKLEAVASATLRLIAEAGPVRTGTIHVRFPDDKPVQLARFDRETMELALLKYFAWEVADQVTQSP